LSQFISYSIKDPESDAVANKERKAFEHLYVTVLDKDPVNGYDFGHINQLSKEDNQGIDPILPILFQTGSPQGPEAGDIEQSQATANATIEQRGNTVRNADLKSYKIRLAEGQGDWNNQYILNLNKHPYDDIRIRNKLSFDYMKMIPGITSLDTQFVQLYVKDVTMGSNTFDSYGLFTHVQQPNKQFLKENGLDPDGYLYRAINFEFNQYPDILKDRNDPSYNKELFETVLQIEGREYHEKLIEMLEDINNNSLKFNKVFDKYFDKDNFLTWLAVNFLMGNIDTSSQNFYLYSSRISDKWYFLPWDYDGAWNSYWQWGSEGSRIHPTSAGISRYWAWPLVRRFFENPENVNALHKKMDALAQIITEEQTKKFLDEYYSTVRPIILQPPDMKLLPEDVERFEQEFYSLVKVPAENMQKYYANLEKPMPIFIGGPWMNDDKMTFTWWKSYDLQQDEIFYDLQISKTPDFSTIVYEQISLQETELTLDLLPAGVYYLRITIRDSKGQEQVAFGSFIDNNGKYFYGVKQFTLK
jgi:spore coat protein H